MAVALDRTVGLSWSRHRIAIETQSELTRGMTVVDRLNVSADANNAEVWDAAAGEHEAADIVWTIDSSRFKAYAESRFGGVRRRQTGRKPTIGCDFQRRTSGSGRRHGECRDGAGNKKSAPRENT